MSQAQYVIELRDPDSDAERYEISEAEVFLGRSKAKSDLVLNDRKASGRHCRIDFVDGGVTIVDLTSTNGTWFEGTKIDSMRLAPGQAVTIGDSSVRLISILFEELPETEFDATRALSADELQGLLNSDSEPSDSVTAVPNESGPSNDEIEMLEDGSDGHVALKPVLDDQLGAINEGSSHHTSVTPELHVADDHTSMRSVANDPVAILSGSDPIQGEPKSTMAFERASVAIGEIDDSLARRAGPLPIPQNSRLLHMQRIVGCTFIAMPLIVIGLMFAPGAEPELKKVTGPGATTVERVALSYTSVFSESVLSVLVSRNNRQNVEAHYHNALDAQVLVANPDTPRAKRMEAAKRLRNVSRYAASAAKMWFGHWEKSRLGLWAAAPFAILGGILLLLGKIRIGASFGIFLPAATLLAGQPVPIFSFSVCAILSVLGLGLVGFHWFHQKRHG